MPVPALAPGQPLSPEALCWRCPPEGFSFASTDELPDLAEVIGQPRALAAIDFAVGMQRPGYNLYALGPEGIGRHTLVRHSFEQAAALAPVPDDWCYVNNFGEPRKPRALRLPAGRGRAFCTDMMRFVEDVRIALRSAFESDEHRTRQQVVEDNLRERRERALAEVGDEASKRGVALLRTPIGFAFAPIRDGKVMAPDDFGRLPEEQQKAAQAAIEELQEKLKKVLESVPQWMKEARQTIRQLNEETTDFAVGHLMEVLRARYADLPNVLQYLSEVRKYVTENVEIFITPVERRMGDEAGPDSDQGAGMFRPYRVNMIVNNGERKTAPVIYEDDPTYDRLLGRIDHRAEMGALLTDFNMIRPGALHTANGGYLILDARKVLTRPLAWEGLKRALEGRQIHIEPMAQALGLISTVTIEPEPIPLNVKVAIVGERLLYYLLSELDPEFSKLFKVAADFDQNFERSPENNLLYARLIATLVRANKLKPFDRQGVTAVLEFAARHAGDAEKLSMEIERLSDLLREADFWAGKNGRPAVGRTEVEQAIEAFEHRLDRVRHHLLEETQRGTLLIDSAGEVIGQVNGLSVLQLGGFSFGRPSRITARVRLGKGDVVDIEREVALGGPLHSKGVLILSGYLSSHYAKDLPLSLAASLVFEQSYGGVEGDSASSAELYALLSAIAETPIRQGLAVTGSVNQRGEVQAIGGVNEKIEGFFDLCAARGLDGRQGVLIPLANVKHLMLQARVVNAVEAGQFKVYPIATIDQGIEILTGLVAGERGADGRFPAASFNGRVEDRLIELAEKRRDFARGPQGEGGDGVA